MFLKSLHGRFMIILTAILIPVGLVSSMLLLGSFERYQRWNAQTSSRPMAENLVRHHLDDLAPLISMREAVMHRFDKLVEINPAIGLYLLDGNGMVQAHSSPTGKLVRRKVDMAPIRALLGGQASFPLLGDDPSDLTRQDVFSAAYVDPAHPQAGVLYVVLGTGRGMMAPRGSEAARFQLDLLGVLAAGTVAVLLFGVMILLLITRKLRRLTDAIQLFVDGKFEQPVYLSRIKPYGGDEIDRLGRAYNAMAETIGVQMREIQATDEKRREMITAVAHDLRTPLAALRGYLETMLLRDGSLGETDRRTYLEIATRQSGNLSRLVDELFELSKLESPEACANAEPFQLAELVYDIVQNLGMRAAQKNVKVDVRMQESTPFVCADIALVERLLTNLLDNAVRHTSPNGQVTISVEPTPDRRMSVAVADTGEGIAPDDLPHVFDRFYRADKSRGSDSGAGGLGLAIARRIVDLHGGEISAASRLGEGTTFVFDLPLAPSRRGATA